MEKQRDSRHIIEKAFAFPEEWVPYRLGDIGEWGAGLTPLTSDALNYDGGDIPWLTTGDLNDSYVHDTSDYITPYAITNCNLELRPINSVMIAMYGATIGKLGIVGTPMATNQACCVCMPRSNLHFKFLFYYLFGIRRFLIAQAEGATQPNISKQKIVKTPIFLPPMEEQKRIAEYLDRETSLIDRYVDKLTALREKYQLLKCALISETISRGLPHHNPDSFRLLRLKDIATFEKGKDAAGGLVQEEGFLPVLSLAYLRGHIETPTFSPISSNSVVCDEEDLIIIWDGAGIGEILRGKKGLLSSTTAVIKERKYLVLKEYIYALRYYIESVVKAYPTGMGIPHVSPNTLYTLPIALPTLEEQGEIVAYLDERCGKLDQLVVAIGKKIDLLTQLKKSLIEEVVTGYRRI